MVVESAFVIVHEEIVRWASFVYFDIQVNLCLLFFMFLRFWLSFILQILLTYKGIILKYAITLQVCFNMNRVN